MTKNKLIIVKLLLITLICSLNNKAIITIGIVEIIKKQHILNSIKFSLFLLKILMVF